MVGCCISLTHSLPGSSVLTTKQEATTLGTGVGITLTVGVTDGAAVGTTVGATDGATVGTTVGATDGAAVDTTVGANTVLILTVVEFTQLSVFRTIYSRHFYIFADSPYAHINIQSSKMHDLVNT